MTEQRKYAKEFERINRRLEAKYFPKVHKALNSKVSSLTSIIKEKGLQAGRNYLHSDLVNKQLADTIKDLYREVGLRHAKRTHSYILAQEKKGYVMAIETKGFGFSAKWIAYILNYLSQFLLKKITFKVNKTTRDKLMAVMEQAIANGDGVDETVRKLDDLPFVRYQAARIVRTEVNRAANVGTLAGTDTSKWQMNKGWVSAHDNRTRGNPMNGDKDHADHWNMDGQVVDFHEKFKDPRSGAALMMPGDVEAEAEDTVNCRCTFYPIAKRDQNGRLIPKAQPAVTPVLGLFKPAIAASPNIGLRVGR